MVPKLQFAQGLDTPEKQSELRKEIFEKHRAELDQIKNNSKLTEVEKKELIIEKRKALKEKIVFCI